MPAPLPPDPPVDLRRLQRRLERASQALGRLDGLTRLLPDPQIFIYLYVRKEAVLSSQIEGTQSSLSDLLAFEAEGLENVPLDDVTEVSSYVAALEHGLRRAAPRASALEPAAPARDPRASCCGTGAGADKEPGEFRRSQNWIGGTRPGNAVLRPAAAGPTDGVPRRLLENVPARTDESACPSWSRPALAHVQFETIHPFLDGNGRVGRLLVTLMLCAEGVLERAAALSQPVPETASAAATTSCSQRVRLGAPGRSGSTSSSRASRRQPPKRQSQQERRSSFSKRIGKQLRESGPRRRNDAPGTRLVSTSSDSDHHLGRAAGSG